MRVVAINGSPRPDGNTRRALEFVAEVLQTQDIVVDWADLGACAPCRGCYACAKARDGRCVLEDDGVNRCVALLREADGLLIGTPVYYAGMSSALKGALDRVFTLCANSGELLRHKVGAGVVVARRNGAVAAFDQVVHYLTYAEMVIPGSHAWNTVYGRAPGEVEQDPEGIQTLQSLGQNMAWLLHRLSPGAEALPPPGRVKKVYTSFVR